MPSTQNGTRTQVSSYSYWQRIFDKPTPASPATNHLHIFSDGAYEELLSCWPPPIYMILISLVELVFFSLDAKHGNSKADGPFTEIFTYNQHKRHEAWRFISYMLVHVNVFHLQVNFIMQLIFGVPLEMANRSWRVVLVYLAGVAAGSLATSVIEPTVNLVGASAGVYALMAAHIAIIIMNWTNMYRPIIQLIVFLLLAAEDVGTALYDLYVLNLDVKVAYVAHLAGALAGLLVGIGLLRNLRECTWKKRLWWAAVTLYCWLMFTGILAHIFWTEHFAKAA